MNELCSFSKLSVTSPTSQLILQPFPRFTYVTVHSPTLPLLHLRHSSFSNRYFASPTSQDFHLRHLASSPWHSNEYKSQYEVVFIRFLQTMTYCRRQFVFPLFKTNVRCTALMRGGIEGVTQTNVEGRHRTPYICLNTMFATV